MALVRRRTQDERRAATREALLRAAVEVVGRKGCVNATLADVAEAAGVSKGALTYHFKSKDDLLDAVLARCGVALRARALAAWEAGGAPADRVRATLRAMWAARRGGGPEVAALADMAALGVHDPRMREAVAELLREAERDVATHLVAGMEALGLRPRVPARVAPRLLLGLLDGLALHGFFAPAEDDEELVRAVEAVVFGLFAL